MPKRKKHNSDSEEEENTDTRSEGNKDLFCLDNHIFFYGEINMDNFKCLRQLIHRLKKHKKIYLHFHSEGGDVQVGLQMYDYLSQESICLHTINEAECSSSATLPFLAGQKRSAFPHASFCIHEIKYESTGKLSKHTKELKHATKQMNDFIEIYLQHLNIDKKNLLELLQRDEYLNYKEAQKLGFLTD